MSNTEISPVVIIGMHRSGTSMITRLLAKAGLYGGSQLDSNHEPLFFMRLNEWVLSQCNASWDRPDNIEFVNRELAEYFHKALFNYLSKNSREGYLDDKLASEYKSVFSLT